MYYVGGAAVAVAGVSAYSLSKLLRTDAAHTRTRIGLVAIALVLLAAFAVRPAPGPASGLASGATLAPAPPPWEAGTAASRQAAPPAATGKSVSKSVASAVSSELGMGSAGMGSARPNHGPLADAEHGPNATSARVRRPAHAKSAHPAQKLGAKQQLNSA
jgi:hypothetical protein